MLLGTAVMLVWLATLPSFGELPQGERQTRIEASANYLSGEFHYTEPTSLYSNDASAGSWLRDSFSETKEHLRPSLPLPIDKTDLAGLEPGKDVAVWLGHSSAFLQLDGKRILIDPNFSAQASPISFIYSAFDGDYPYSDANMPAIDVLVISHDHWDHLDYPTLGALRSKVKAIVVPLGIGSHLERWGYAPEVIHELDWNQHVAIAQGLTVHVLPARHFSGRGLRSNRTLFAGFLFETPQRKVFYSGDGGYGPHFAEIGKRFGPIDLALLENGQYDTRWAQIHMLPEEAVKAAQDLRAHSVLPVHAGRFALASHAWDDPYQRISAASQGKAFRLLTPRMGQVVDIGDDQQHFEAWWNAPGP